MEIPLPYFRPIRHRPLEDIGLGRSVWRYMALWNFEDLVRSQCLFFARLRHIIDGEIDPFEGSLADVNYEEPGVNVQHMLREILAPGQDQDAIDTVTRQFGNPDRLREQQQWGRDQTYISCWFLDEFELQRMWNEYVPDGKGVAVQSTLRQLRSSFDEARGNVCMQSVIYYDPESRQMVPLDPFHTPLYKHAKWRHEQEFRCFEIAPQSHGMYAVQPDGRGVWVPCDLQALIQRVRLAPNVPPDLVDHVRAELQDVGLPCVRVEPSRVNVKRQSR
jgi:hypothetical protein